LCSERDVFVPGAVNGRAINGLGWRRWGGLLRGRGSFITLAAANELEAIQHNA
jgi:hypothetical protein